MIVLRYFVDLPAWQTGQTLGVSEQAVRSLSHRAIRKLRAALSDEVVAAEVSHDV